MPNTKLFQSTEHDASIISAAYQLAIAMLPAFDGDQTIKETGETKPFTVDAKYISDLIDALNKRDKALLASEAANSVVENPLQSGNRLRTEKPADPPLEEESIVGLFS